MAVKIFYIGDNKAECTKWIEDLTLVETMEESEIVLFGRGPFVNPLIWGGKMVTIHGLNFKLDDPRDISDIKLFMKARKMDKKIVGIGRGAILCGALSGSNVVQYHENPRSFHYSDDIYGGIKAAPWSMESRMVLYPAKLNHTEVAIYGTTLRQNRMHLIDNATDIKQLGTGEVQTCMFFETNCLCICPLVWEAVGEDFEPFVKHCNHLISDFKDGRIGPMANPFGDEEGNEDDGDEEEDSLFADDDFTIEEKPEKMENQQVFFRMPGSFESVSSHTFGFVPSEFYTSAMVGGDAVKKEMEKALEEQKEKEEKKQISVHDYWRSINSVKK